MLAITAETLIDGKGGDPIQQAVLLVENDKIIAAGPAGAVKIPDGAQIVDASGETVMPGLIDCHVHVMRNSASLEQRLFTPKAVSYYRAAENLAKMLRAGFTTTRDAGEADAGIRQALETGLIPGPRLVVSGTIGLTGGLLEKRYPSGAEIVDENAWRICDGGEAVRKTVRRVLREGVDFVKVFTTGGVGAPQGHPFTAQWTLAELQVIVEEAQRYGAGVMAHAEGVDGIKLALRAGVTSIEHGYVLDDEAIELFLTTGIFLVPTQHISTHETSGLSAASLRKKQQLRAAQAGSLRRAHDAGVKIALGTDSFRADMHGRNAIELSLMMENGGLSAMEAIVAGTSNAARCCLLGDEVGTLEAGKQADFLLVEGDPLADIAILRDSARITVYQRGALVQPGA